MRQQLEWLDAMVLVCRTRNEFLALMKILWPCLTPQGQSVCANDMMGRELRAFQPGKP